MTRRSEIRRLILSGAVFPCLVFLASALPQAAEQTKPSGEQNEPAVSSVLSPSDSPPARPADASSDPLSAALALTRKGDFDAAIKKYQQFLQETPKSPEAYAGLTRVYLKKQDVTQANDTIIKALQVTDSWPVRVALGEVYFRQGKIHEAEQEWVTVINSKHLDARAFLGLARVRRAIAMNKSAKTMIDKARQLDPSDPDIERFWVWTLPSPERIKYLESYLSEATESDAAERDNLQSYLSYLKERAKQRNPYCRLVSKVKTTQTPLVRLLIDPSHLRGYGLSVDLNGTRSNLMLDTGASGILVKRQTAERAGITKLTETKVFGIGDKGAKNGFVGIANSIRVGELEFQNCPVEVIEGRSVGGEDGLIGADVFEHFLVDIDFPNEKLKLSELPKRPGDGDQELALKSEEDDSDEPDASGKSDLATEAGAKEAASKANPSGPQDRYIAPEMRSFTQVFRFGHDLLISTKVGDTPMKLFLMDTGSLTNFISPEAAREITHVHGDSDMTVSGISGTVKKVYRADKAILQFGNLRQENQDMTAFDMSRISEGNGTEVSGFLGFVVLRFLDIKIDYRDALVDFSYDDKRYKFVTY